MDFGPLAASVVTTLILIGGIYVVARRLGLGPAAQALSTTLQQTMAAQTAEIASLGRQLVEAQRTILEMTAEFKVCKARLVKMEKFIASHAIGTPDDA